MVYKMLVNKPLEILAAAIFTTTLLARPFIALLSAFNMPHGLLDWMLAHEVGMFMTAFAIIVYVKFRDSKKVIFFILAAFFLYMLLRKWLFA